VAMKYRRICKFWFWAKVHL